MYTSAQNGHGVPVALYILCMSVVVPLLCTLEMSVGMWFQAHCSQWCNNFSPQPRPCLQNSLYRVTSHHDPSPTLPSPPAGTGLGLQWFIAVLVWQLTLLALLAVIASVRAFVALAHAGRVHPVPAPLLCTAPSTNVLAMDRKPPPGRARAVGSWQVSPMQARRCWRCCGPIAPPKSHTRTKPHDV